MKAHIVILAILAAATSASSQATEIDPLKIYDKLDTRIYDRVLTHPETSTLTTEYRYETNQIVFLDAWPQTNTPAAISVTNDVFRMAPLSLCTNAGFVRTNDHENVRENEKPQQKGGAYPPPLTLGLEMYPDCDTLPQKEKPCPKQP